MNTYDYRNLLSEKTTLENLLANVPNGNIIDKISIMNRLSEVDRGLSTYSQPVREPAQFTLTFKGSPIFGSHGIAAKFGTSVMGFFSDTVATIGASLSTTLGSRGTIPNRSDFELLIVGTAQGSFGFKMEEVQKVEPLFGDDPSPVETAISKTISIMEASLGSDEDLDKVLVEVSPRALSSLRSFLKCMVDQEAICAISFNDKVFRYERIEDVRTSESRLGAENIHEEETELLGKFKGVLPKGRTFEFEISESKEIISGRVDESIDDAASLNEVLDELILIKVHITRVGTRRPRYLLLGYSES